MSANWELAVSHAVGEYVTVLGDDDGLLLHALQELDRLIARENTQVIRWNPAFYLWPSIALSSDANYLSIPLSRAIFSVQAVPAIASVIRFQMPYNILPMLYNAMIHRSLLSSLR